jgi:hypothetical protein
LNQKSPIELISREEIHAVYVRGQEAVIELIEGLVEKIGKLEERVESLEGKNKKNSTNSSKPPSGDGFGKKTKSMMVYLMAGQLLPSARTCEILSDIVGVSVSEGTLFNPLFLSLSSYHMDMPQAPFNSFYLLGDV